MGGRRETGYPAVGYIVAGRTRDVLSRPATTADKGCVATLIGPRVAITAAHCMLAPSLFYGLAFGAVGSGLPIPVRAFMNHPKYNSSTTLPSYEYDLAVLFLERAPPITPMPLGKPKEGNTYRYVGYGRTTPGPYGVTTGLSGERKSTLQRIFDVKERSVYVRGIDGGLCWGDSGGPLISTGSTPQVMGVLAHFWGHDECHSKNTEFVFTSTEGKSEFLGKAFACQDSPDPESCILPVGCEYRCNTPGSCNSGWYCDHGCYKYTGCGETSCQYACSQYGHRPGVCSNGWYCDGNCLIYTACVPSVPCQSGFSCRAYGYKPNLCHGGWYCDGNCLKPGCKAGE